MSISIPYNKMQDSKIIITDPKLERIRDIELSMIAQDEFWNLNPEIGIFIEKTRAKRRIVTNQQDIRKTLDNPKPNAIVVAESGRGMNFYTRNQKEKEIMLHEKDV